MWKNIHLHWRSLILKNESQVDPWPAGKSIKISDVDIEFYRNIYSLGSFLKQIHGRIEWYPAILILEKSVVLNLLFSSGITRGGGAISLPPPAWNGSEGERTPPRLSAQPPPLATPPLLSVSSNYDLPTVIECWWSWRRKEHSCVAIVCDQLIFVWHKILCHSLLFPFISMGHVMQKSLKDTTHCC